MTLGILSTRHSLLISYLSAADSLRCHLRCFSSQLDSFGIHNQAPKGKMGLTWSKKNDGSDAPTPEWTSIDSKPVDKLYEPIAISMRLPSKTISKVRSQRKTYSWNVDFEVDVACLQRRFELCSIPTTFSDDIERILVTPDMMRGMVKDNEVSIDEMCNICAIHMVLRGDEDREMSVCLVVDISRNGHSEIEDMADLTRRIYGYTNQEPQKQVMR